MNTITVAPLLLDNEVLRITLRQRDEQDLLPLPGLCVPQVVRPHSLTLLQAAVTACPAQTAAKPATWPEALQQLHWELSASTTLRPLAKLMGTAAVLPDPWSRQGGLHGGAVVLTEGLRQHPGTQLFTLLRVDVVLRGQVTVTAPETDLQWQLVAGDMLLLAADLPVVAVSSNDAQVWTSYYYSPDPCCCRQARVQGGAI
jgi:hypothetical protein